MRSEECDAPGPSKSNPSPGTLHWHWTLDTALDTGQCSQYSEFSLSSQLSQEWPHHMRHILWLSLGQSFTTDTLATGEVCVLWSFVCWHLKSVCCWHLPRPVHDDPMVTSDHTAAFLDQPWPNHAETHQHLSCHQVATKL